MFASIRQALISFTLILTLSREFECSTLSISPKPFDDKIIAFIGQSFQLTCQNTASQKSEMSWILPSNQEITSISKSNFSSYVTQKSDQETILNIRNISPADAGAYTCKALSGTTISQVRFELELQSKI